MRGDFYVGEPSSYAKNGRSYYSNPKDWREKHEKTVAFLKDKGCNMQASSPWCSIWTLPNGESDWKIDYWEDDFSLEEQLYGVDEYISLFNK